MGNFNIGQAINKILTEGKDISLNQKGNDFLWLLASQPKKTFSSADILDEIMASGIMIHEKQFIEILAQNICRKTGIQVIQKTKTENLRFKNKFMNNDFDYL
ncbi:MAG: DNA-binding response OmpR family regulator [Urechidicola sp.]|jgi:DNA-binding response OmpR family regulator